MNHYHTPIIVLSYNKPKLTQRCITAVMDAGYETNQIYLIDNGSRKGVLEQHLDTFPGLNSFRLEQNKGFSGGFNSALNAVFQNNFDSALFLTNDTEIMANTLEECEECSRRNDAGIVAPCLTYRNHPDKIDSIGGWFDRKNGTLRHYQEPLLSPILKENDYIPGTALWISRTAFETIGGTNEDYFMYWEDVDFSFRAHLSGIKQARCYEARIRHGIGQTCHKKPLYTTYYFQRNRIRFCRQYLRPNEWEKISKLIESELMTLEKRWIKNADTRRLNYLKELKIELFSMPL